MKRPPLLKSAGRQFAIYGLGDVLNKGVAFLLLPFYTHYLHPRDYGTLEMLDLTIYLISLVLAVGIPQAVVRYYHEHRDLESKNLVVSSGFVATIVLSLLALVPLITCSGLFSLFILKSPEYSRLFVIVFLTMFLNLGIDIPMTYFRVREMPIWFISFSTARLALNLGLNIFFIVFLGMGVEGMLRGSLIASGLIGTLLFIYLIREVGLRFSGKIFLPMVRYGFPIIGSWLGMYLINFSDRFLLQRLLPASDSLSTVGIYSLAYKFGMLPNFLILSPFFLFWGSKQFQILRDEPEAPHIFSRVFNYFSFMLFFCGLGLCILIHDIIRLVADPSYISAARYVPWIALAYLCNGIYLFVDFPFLYRKKTRYLALNVLVMAALNIILNFILIPMYGAMGSAVATFAAISLMLLVTFFLAQRLYSIPYDYGRVAKMAAMAVALYLLAEQVNPGTLWVSMIVKTLFALAYPVLLLLVWVLSGQEVRTPQEYLNRLVSAFKGIKG